MNIPYEEAKQIVEDWYYGHEGWKRPKGVESFLFENHHFFNDFISFKMYHIPDIARRFIGDYYNAVQR